MTNDERAPFPQVGAKASESFVYVVESAMQPASSLCLKSFPIRNVSA